MLTMFRFALIPVFVVCFIMHPSIDRNIFGDGIRESWNFHIPALCIYIIASLTDALDGRIARKYNLITNFGKLFDPFADKLMVVTIMLCLAFHVQSIWFTIPLILMMIKESGMFVGSIIMLSRGIVVYSKWYGKVAQFLIVSAVGLTFFADYFNSINFPVHLILLWIGTAFAYYAGVQYTKNITVRKVYEK